MKKSYHTYTKKEALRFRKMGDVTTNGVVYDWWLVGPQGAGFVLLDEGQKPDQNLIAATELRTNRDVVGAIRLAEVTNNA